jgi:hypothetical protein
MHRFIVAVIFALLSAGFALADVGGSMIWMGAAPPSTAATPQIIQHLATSPTPPAVGGPAGNAYKMYISPTGVGDVIVLGFTGISGQTPTVTDSAGDSITTGTNQICAADAGATNSKSYLYAIAPTPGTTWFIVTFTGGGTLTYDFFITEWNNISSITAQGHNCQANLPSTAGVVTPASFNSTNNDATGGNLIVNYTALATGSNIPACKASNYTPQTGYTRLGGYVGMVINGNGDGFQTVEQYDVQRTHGATVASMTMTGETCSSGNGDPFNSLTAALAIGTAGITYPTTIHVVQAQRIVGTAQGGPNLPASMTIPITALGNLRVFTAEALNGNGSWTSANGTVTSSDGCNFTTVNLPTAGNAVWYAQGCSPCLNCSVTIPLHTGTALTNSSTMYYDIANAQASSYQTATQSTDSCTNGANANEPSITPTSGQTPGLALHIFPIGVGPVVSPIFTSPSGAVPTVPTFTGQGDGELMGFGDEDGYYYYSTAATQNWTIQINNGDGSTTCSPSVALFK